MEEALLLSGQFDEAVRALFDWLANNVPAMSEECKVRGDVDTTQWLLEQHESLLEELRARESNIGTVHRAAEELR